ncbi:hypothetical protein KIV56_10065 [Cryobacterium breve]|uniref:Uncharacterized protein n=1 Tax=Cryobacterium breve TaxID=1259258 RepID=A0ABY7N9H9_9MICO|nr:hypothetical protein [Cryobacterium breve]WBM78925.1 hypothetical protein KIV56_10065 [Cryobacterium breve]
MATTSTMKATGTGPSCHPMIPVIVELMYPSGEPPEQEAESLQRDVHGQRGGDGGEPGEPDQRSVDHPDDGRHDDHEHEAEDDHHHRLVVVDEERTDHHEEPGEGPHGQVDASDQQRNGLTQGDETERRDKGEHRVDVEVGEVAGVLAEQKRPEQGDDTDQEHRGGVVALQETTETGVLGGRFIGDDGHRSGRRTDGGVDHAFFADRSALEHFEGVPSRHHDDLVAETLELLRVRGGHDDGDAGG